MKILQKDLKKKLKQLDDIKKKQAAGAELNADQKAKLATETDLNAQIAKIQAS